MELEYFTIKMVKGYKFDQILGYYIGQFGEGRRKGFGKEIRWNEKGDIQSVYEGKWKYN